MRLFRIIFVAMLLSGAFPAAAWSEDTARGGARGGGVPVLAALSIGLGEDFSDDNFVVINGFGAIGFLEFWSSDIWITGGLYTGLAFAGDLTNDEMKATEDPMDMVEVRRDLPSEGWGINPGVALGLTIGSIPQVDVHLLGYGGPSLALLSHFQEQSVNGEATMRFKTDEIDGKLGFSYGGLVAVAYTGNIPWLRGMSLGVDGGYHNNTFDRWHFGLTIGVAF